MSAKKTVFTIPFSHLDLFWGGTREECLSRGCRIIATALDLLEANPDYRFMIESTNFLEFHLDCHPEDRERIKRQVREGRLELIPMRAIIYSHLPSGETTVRNLLYGREFCREELAAEPTVMSLSDIPGVTPQLPQIAKLAGMTEIVLSRGFKEHTDHVVWTAPDGTAIRAYCPNHYAYLCNLFSKPYETMRKNEGPFLEYFDAVDYPQIFHWGMDLYLLNATVLGNIRRMNRESGIEFVFSSFREFFDRTGDVPAKEFAGEIPSTWPNIESSWPDLWPLDLAAENALADAEFFGALDRLAGNRDDYPAGTVKRAWLQLLDAMDHNQNGIGGEIADADKRNLKRLAEGTARGIAERYSRRLAARAAAPSATAATIVVFNPLSWKRSGVVRARTACYGSSYATMFDGDTSVPHYREHACRRFRLTDETGREIPYQKETHLMMLADTVELSFFAEAIPAFGCRTYYVELLEEGKAFPSPFTVADDRDEDRRNASRHLGSDRIENRFFRLEIHRLTGELSLFDKQNSRMLFEHAAIVGFEEKRGEYIYDMELSGRVMPALIDSVETVENNAVYYRTEIRGSVYGEPFVQRITLAADAPTVEIENTIRWNEIRFVRLEQTFPFASEEEAEIRYGVPFGMVRYPETIYGGGVWPEGATRNIRLVRDWVDASDSKGGFTVGADHRMWTFDGNTLRNCMIRGIGWTSGGVILNEDGSQTGVQRPPKGEYTFRFRITPHGAERHPQYRTGWELNAPLRPVAVADATVSETPGLKLPAMPDSSGTTVVVSAVKPAESGRDVVFRCFESMGEAATLVLPEQEGGRWFETGLDEQHPVPAGTRIAFRPFEIKTLVRQNENSRQGVGER